CALMARRVAVASAPVAVAVAVVIEVLIHRDLKLSDLWSVTMETSRLLGGLFPVLLFAISLNVFLTYEQAPQNFVSYMASVIDSPLQFLLAANVLLLVVGMVIDIGSAVLILSPLLTPLAEAYGLDPVHFGIVMIVNLGIGYLTPPLGLNIIIAMAAFREDFWTISKAVAPFILLMLGALAVIAAFPQIALMFVA
ncbi:MAG: TRAP transporter large permease subunit, partial [Pseudomonadota bacterium]